MMHEPRLSSSSPLISIHNQNFESRSQPYQPHYHQQHQHHHHQQHQEHQQQHHHYQTHHYQHQQQQHQQQQLDQEQSTNNYHPSYYYPHSTDSFATAEPYITHQHDRQDFLKTIPRQHHQSHYQAFYNSTSTPSYNLASTYRPQSPSSSSTTSLSKHLPPHISVQRSSGAASPATINTSLSTRSTPSPSPARMAMLSNVSGNNNDFTLYDNNYLNASQDYQKKPHQPLLTQDHISNNGTDEHDDMSNGTLYESKAPTNYPAGPFPIIVSGDGHQSHHYTDSSSYNYANLAHVDGSTPLYDVASQNPRISHSSHDIPAQTAKYGNMNLKEEVAEEDVPALSPATGHIKTRSSPPSISSVDSSKSAVTPERNYSDADDKISQTFPATLQLHNPIPKLGRTYSDAVQDELYNPELIRRSEYVPPKKPRRSVHKSNLSTTMAVPDIFHEAQQQHQYDKSSPKQTQIFRDRSPFRANSPFHPVNSKFGTFNPKTNVATPLPQPQLSTNFEKNAPSAIDNKTISPRDALLDYAESEGDGVQADLFAPLQKENSSLSNDSISSSSSLSNNQMQQVSTQDSDAGDQSVVGISSSQPDSIQPLEDRLSYNTSNHSYYDTPVEMSDIVATPFTENVDQLIEKPADTKANTGTYTCTYTGCGQRFTTSAKLQKHRRENHRKSPATQTSVSTPAAIASRNAQPGPHRCMRPNANGRPCNSVFSRPYDLTRHEDTIHNSRKEKVRCEICNDEKTFSRPDALVRHRRVKHGIH